MSKTVKFYGKNVNDGKFADYQYIGSVTVQLNDHTRESLIDIADRIGGTINGPLIAMIEGESSIRVLKV